MMERGNLFSISLVMLLITSGMTALISLPRDMIPLILSQDARASFAGGSGTAYDPYQISNVIQLQDMSADLTAHYILINDIDASTTINWYGGKGFDPVGDVSNKFSGSLEGQNYNITDLFINRPSENYVGLFGYMESGAVVSNLSPIDVNIVGDVYVGGLVGYNDRGAVSNCYSIGNVNGDNHVGGLVGYKDYGTVSNCYAIGIVSGADSVGGLMGSNYGTVSNCYATGIVSGNSHDVGGLVGSNYGTVSNCYATGNVTGYSNVGGLMGSNYVGMVYNCYSTGDVNGNEYVGGLVGCNIGPVSNCYSTGNVSGVGYIGGLVGYNYDALVSNCYSTGNVSGGDYVGGLMGSNYGTVSNSFWDTQTSGQSGSDGGTGRTTKKMKEKQTFTDAGWDFATTWSIVEDVSYPFFLLQYTNPVILSNIHDATEDEAYSLQMKSKICWLPGCENSATYSLTTDCGWLSISPSGLLSGMPLNEDVGTWGANVKAMDLSGNIDKQNFTFSVININDAPLILTSSLPEAVEDQPYWVIIDGEDLDPTGDVLTWEIVQTEEDFLNIDSSTGNLTGIPDNDDVGRHEVVISADDGNGGITRSTFTLTVVDVNDPPVILTEDRLSIEQGSMYYVSYHSSDIDDLEIFQWYLNTNASFLSIENDTGILTGTPENDDVGIYFVNVTAEDQRGGRGSHNFTLEVIDVNDIPEWVNIPINSQVVEGKLYTFDVNATDIDAGGTLTYNISSQPSSDISIDEFSGIITWIGSSAGLTLNVSISASDGEDDIYHNFIITVMPNPAPTSFLVSPMDEERVPSKGILLEWEGEDDGVDLKFDIYLDTYHEMVSTLDSSSLWMEDVEGTSIHTGELEEGKTYYWTVIPKDIFSSGICVDGIFRFKVNTPPSIQEFTISNVYVGEEFRFSIPGMDLDNDDLEFSLSESPSGMEIHDDKIFWTPSKDQIGIHTINISLSDGYESISKTFELEVVEKEIETDTTEEDLLLIPILIIVIILIIVVFVILIIGAVIGILMWGKKKKGGEIQKEE